MTGCRRPRWRACPVREPLVILTKADLLVDDIRHASPSPVDVVTAAAPGVDVLVVSAFDGTGMDVLRALLAGTPPTAFPGTGPGPDPTAPRGRSAVLVGPSGVGKSTLAKALLGEKRLAVGPTRTSDGKGRHTTVRRELIVLPSGGVLIDTPGIRGVGVWDVDQGLDSAFADIAELAADCRFADCEHHTEPGCAVLAAVEDGSLPERRLASYRRLLRENAWLDSRRDARLAAEQRRRWKTIEIENRRRFAGRDRQGRNR